MALKALSVYKWQKSHTVSTIYGVKVKITGPYPVIWDHVPAPLVLFGQSFAQLRYLNNLPNRGFGKIFVKAG